MNSRQTRKLGWFVVAAGCVLIVAARLGLGLIAVMAGLILISLGARCPHCGKLLANLSPFAGRCPRCRNIL